MGNSSTNVFVETAQKYIFQKNKNLKKKIPNWNEIFLQAKKKWHKTSEKKTGEI